MPVIDSEYGSNVLNGYAMSACLRDTAKGPILGVDIYLIHPGIDAFNNADGDSDGFPKSSHLRKHRRI